MKINIIVLFILALLYTSVAQVNKSELEAEIKSAIDSVRQVYGLKPLLNEKVCYYAADIHSKYMFENGVLNHFEMKADSLYSPADRVIASGGEGYLVGENVAYIDFASNTDSEWIVNTIVETWIHSKGHFANILSSEYDVTGVSIKTEENSSKIYITQVFANVPETYVYKPNKELFQKDTFSLDSLKGFLRRTLPPPHKKHAWKLELADDSKFTKVNPKWLDENITLDVREDGLYLCVKNLRYFRKLFKEKKDGLAFEVVNYETTYSCAPENNYIRPNRVNGGCIFNGRVTKPIYQKELLARIDSLIEQTKEDRGLECAGLFIDSIPSYSQNKELISLLYIRDRKVAKFIDFQGYCGSLMLPPLPKANLKYQFPTASINQKISIENVDFRVYFKRNSTDFHSDELDSILSVIDDDRVFVKEIRVNAFASVEGTSEINAKLYKKRGEVLLNSFQERQTQDIELIVNTQENFEMFKEQVKNSKFSYMKDWSTDSIRLYANTHIAEFDTLLDAQRYGEVLLVLGVEERASDRFDQAKAEYQKRFERLQKVSVGQKRRDTKRLIDLQGLLIQATLADSIKYEDYLEKLPTTGVMVLDYNLRLCDFLRKNLPDKQLYITLESIYKHMPNNKLVREQMDVLILNNQFSGFFRRKLNIDVVDRFLEANSSLPDSVKKEYLVYKDFILSNKHFKRNQGANKYRGNHSLDRIKEYYDTLSLDLVLRKSLGYYFLAFGKTDWAIDYFKPFASEEMFDLGVYIDMVKTIVAKSMLEGTSDYQAVIMEASERIGKHEFCDMFFGPCNIDFQVFKDASVKSLYCEVCKSLHGK